MAAAAAAGAASQQQQQRPPLTASEQEALSVGAFVSAMKERFAHTERLLHSNRAALGR